MEPDSPRQFDQRFGRYLVDAVLGTGAFATVYRASDERLDDRVAVKVLAENHSLNAELRSRFITEGRVLRRIDDPHVLRVYDLGETDQRQPYLVLEYAAQGNLSNRVATARQRGWSPNRDDILAVAEPLAGALSAIHHANVVHRDVNPSNVLIVNRRAEPTGAPSQLLIADDERLVLADLGLCKDLALNSGYTSAGGTDGFRPPELQAGPTTVDRRADIWSASAVLVWLTTGAPPGRDRSAAALVRSGVPLALAGPLERGLDHDPERRHRDADAWIDDFRAVLAQPGAPTRSVPAARPVAPPPPPVPGDLVGPRSTTPPSSTIATVWHSLWIVLLLPLGFTTWAGFLYIGWRAKHRVWKWCAAGYGAALIVAFVFAFLAPTDESGGIESDSGWFNATMAIIVAIWIGGIVHGALVNRAWLRHHGRR